MGNIIVKCLAATDTKGTRYRVTWDGKSVIVAHDYRVTGARNQAWQAVMTAWPKMSNKTTLAIGFLAGEFVGGQIGDAQYVFIPVARGALGNIYRNTSSAA